MSALAFASFFAYVVVYIIRVIKDKISNKDDKHIERLNFGFSFFSLITGCIAFFVILWVYYSFVVGPA